MHRREHDAKLPRTLLLQLFENRIAVERGKIDVEEQQRRLWAAARVHSLEHLESFAPVAIVEEPVAARLEPEGEQLGERRIVLDDNYVRASGGTGPGGTRGE